MDVVVLVTVVHMYWVEVVVQFVQVVVDVLVVVLGPSFVVDVEVVVL